MKVYYLGGVVLAVVLFLVLFAITGIAGCSESKKEIKEIKQAEKDTIVIRYYDSDNIEQAGVRYVRVDKDDTSVTLVVPRKAGYTFAGFYDGPDPDTAMCYADSNGELYVLPQQSILLYPVFTREG